MQLYRRSSHVTVANVTVWGSQQWPNNDGVDFGARCCASSTSGPPCPMFSSAPRAAESCAHVVYRNVSSFTGDDGIVFGSGNCNEMLHPWPGGSPGPTTDVLIENCTLSSYSCVSCAQPP